VNRAIAAAVVLAVLPGLTSGAMGAHSASSPEKNLPSVAEARAIGERIEHVIGDNDPAAFNELFDMDGLLAVVTRGKLLGGEHARAFAEGIRDNFHPAEPICWSVQSGGRYKLLRIGLVDGRRTVLFRLTCDTRPMTYHRWCLDRNADGGVRIVDSYVYAEGERFSDRMRRVYLVCAADADPRVRGGLAPWVRDFADHGGAYRRMPLLIARGAHAEALKIYSSLPASVQSMKVVLIQRARAASGVSDQAYNDAAKAFARAFGDDPAVDLISVDRNFARKRYDQAVAAIDRVEHKIGPDPYLNLLRANAYWQAGQLDNAKVSADRAARGEPDLLDAHRILLAVSLREEDFDRTVDVLTVLHERFGLRVSGLTESPEYARFVESDAYKRWTRRRAGDAVKAPVRRPACEDESVRPPSG